MVGDQLLHGEGVRGPGVSAVLDRPGEAGRRLDVEVGQGQRVARHPLGVGDRDVVEALLDRGQGGLEREERRIEAGEVGPERRRVPWRRLDQRGGDGGGHGGHPRDVVPEVGVGVAAGDVEHRGGDHDPRVPGIGAEERLHPGVVAGAVLDDDLGLGQRRGVGGARLEEVGIGVGVGDQRGHADVAPAELAGDVAPEVLGRHHVDDRRCRGRRRCARDGTRAARQAGQGQAQGAGQGDETGATEDLHNHNGNHFG